MEGGKPRSGLARRARTGAPQPRRFQILILALVLVLVLARSGGAGPGRAGQGRKGVVDCSPSRRQRSSCCHQLPCREIMPTLTPCPQRCTLLVATPTMTWVAAWLACFDSVGYRGPSDASELVHLWEDHGRGEVRSVRSRPCNLQPAPRIWTVGGERTRSTGHGLTSILTNHRLRLHHRSTFPVAFPMGSYAQAGHTAPAHVLNTTININTSTSTNTNTGTGARTPPTSRS